MRKWEELEKRLLSEKGIFSKRISAQKLKEMFKAGQAVVRWHNNRIIGFVGLWSMGDESWFEIGSVWVDEKFRGKGIISKMFREIFSSKRNGRNIACVVNSSRAIIHLLQKKSFQEVNLSMPVEPELDCPKQQIIRRCLAKEKTPRLFFSYA